MLGSRCKQGSGQEKGMASLIEPQVVLVYWTSERLESELKTQGTRASSVLFNTEGIEQHSSFTWVWT